MGENYNELLSRYTKGKTYKDPRYGEFTVYNSHTDPHDQLLQKRKWTNTKPESKELLSQIENRRKNDNKSLSELRGFQLDQDEQWCSTFYEFKMLFEFYDRD